MIRFCSGDYLFRWYFIPTIELERFAKGHVFICLAFLKWYIGICIDRSENDHANKTGENHHH